MKNQKYRIKLRAFRTQGRDGAKPSRDNFRELALEWVDLKIAKCSEDRGTWAEGYVQALLDFRFLLTTPGPPVLWELDCRPSRKQRSALRSSTAQIHLDGKPLDKVFAADSEAGLVCRYRTDPDGRVITSRGKIETETLKGRVRIYEIEQTPVDPTDPR